MGTEVCKSWALSHVHIVYMDNYLDNAYARATSLGQQHEIACAGTVNLLAYLGWLRGGKVFWLHPRRPPSDPTRRRPEPEPTKRYWSSGVPTQTCNQVGPNSRSRCDCRIRNSLWPQSWKMGHPASTIQLTQWDECILYCHKTTMGQPILPT
jgi:hypothetical protein